MVSFKKKLFLETRRGVEFEKAIAFCWDVSFKETKTRTACK